MINALYIETVEATPDTLITLCTNKKYVVRETVDEVKAKTIQFYSQVNLFAAINEVKNNE